MNGPLLLLLGVTILASCSRGGEHLNAPFAYVDDSPVTNAQLEFMKTKFGLGDASLVTQADAERKLREMLVESRAMAILVEKDLSEEERRELDLRIATYREELLVKKYLEAHSVPEPVSAAAVAAYYEKHPEEFGGGRERSFEVLSTSRELSGTDRNRALDYFSDAGRNRDWAAIARKGSALGISYKRARSRIELLDTPLKNLVSETGVGKVSNVHLGKGMMIVRVVDERIMAPKPLTEVSAEIRKKLAPNQLKEAVKKASAEALKKVDVEWEESPERPES